ncbi:MAG: 2-oxoglutarate ferredoxin oxidoreductase subunit delta [Desulfobacteraceae bacterium Eth-SRB1]|nr:MAG: 2-oxoglutarate ferredoxin oxidoreductase subunit delta [Desulfobacteraceae bacterium Eth-SRB1]
MKFWRVPLDADDIQVSKGIVYILEDRCKGCGYCIEFCPRHVLEFSSKINAKGYHLPAVIKAEECLSCHYCEIICPEFAIYSIEIPCESTENTKGIEIITKTQKTESTK